MEFIWEAILGNTRREGKRGGEGTELRGVLSSQLHCGQRSLISPGDSGNSVAYTLHNDPIGG